MAADHLAAHAEASPDKPAVLAGERVVDYATLDRRANKAAHLLDSLGCSKGDRVAIMSCNSIEYVEIGNALRRLDAVIVPVNYRLRGAEVAYVLRDSGAKAVLADADHVPVVEAALHGAARPPRLVALEAPSPGWVDYQGLTRAESASIEPVNSAESVGAPMIYTSGTTGNPKGTWRPDGIDLANLVELIVMFGLGHDDVHLVCGPLYHSAVALLSALHQVVGATLVIQRKFDAAGALELIERHHVTTTFMAPTLLHRLVDEQQVRPRDVSSLRAVMMSAAPCPYPLKTRAEALFGRVLWEFYGSTETGVNTMLRPEDQLRKPGSCGTAMPGQEIRLVRADGTEAEVGEPGELMVRTTWLAEYFGQPQATASHMHDGFFSVGDIAYRDEEGFYFICDRSTDMIISGGVNIYPAEVEAVLSAHPAVMDVAVIGVPDDRWGESVKAVVQLRPGAGGTAEELIAFCAERLAGFKKPRSVDFVDELPRDAAGKLLKRQVRERYWSGAGRRI